MQQKKKPNTAVRVAEAALRGAASGGGPIGAVAGGVQTSINTVKNIKSSANYYNQNRKKQNSAPKQNRTPHTSPIKKPVPAKPMKTAPKPSAKPVATKKPTIKKR